MFVCQTSCLFQRRPPSLNIGSPGALGVRGGLRGGSEDEDFGAEEDCRLERHKVLVGWLVCLVSWLVKLVR